MDIKQLKYFVTVIDMNSFSRAGKHLFVTQSTLSKAIRNLEQELGVQLIYFSGKKMYATDHGLQLYNMAQNMISQHSAIIETIHGSYPQEKGVLKIGIPPISGTCVFPQLAASFLEKYPGIELAVEPHSVHYTIQQMVEKNLLDVGFVLLPVLSDAFETVAITKSNYVVVTSTKNPLSRYETLGYADLQNQPFVLLGQDFRTYQEVIAGCRMAGFEPRILMRIDYWDMILQLVKLDMAISVLPLPILEAFPNDGLASIRLSDAVLNWEVVMITSKNRYETTSLKLFKDHVKAMVGGDDHR